MIFDLFIIALIAGAGYLGYKYGTPKELYRLIKIFVVLSAAGAYGDSFGRWLTHIGLLRANDWAVLSLTGFLLVFAIVWGIIRAIETLSISQNLKESKTNSYFGIIANIIIAVFITTFASFMSTQLSFTNKSYKQYLVNNSFIYIHMDRACRKVLTAEFVNDMISDNQAASTSKMIQTITK